MSSKTLAKFLEENLEDLKSKGLYNVIDPLESSNESIITIGGKEYINLSSNNYLGLATDSRLQEAIGAIHKYGVGAGAVRTINGTLDLHIKLEETIAKFKHTEARIAYQSGFNCNMARFQPLWIKMMQFFQTN